MLNSLHLLLFWEAHEPRHLKKETTVDGLEGADLEYILTDFLNKRRRRKLLAGFGSGSLIKFSGFYTLKSAFQGFRVIQTGFQLLLLKTYLL